MKIARFGVLAVVAVAVLALYGCGSGYMSEWPSELEPPDGACVSEVGISTTIVGGRASSTSPSKTISDDFFTGTNIDGECPLGEVLTEADIESMKLIIVLNVADEDDYGNPIMVTQRVEAETWVVEMVHRDGPAACVSWKCMEYGRDIDGDLTATGRLDCAALQTLVNSYNAQADKTVIGVEFEMVLAVDNNATIEDPRYDIDPEGLFAQLFLIQAAAGELVLNTAAAPARGDLIVDGKTGTIEAAPAYDAFAEFDADGKGLMIGSIVATAMGDGTTLDGVQSLHRVHKDVDLLAPLVLAVRSNYVVTAPAQAQLLQAPHSISISKDIFVRSAVADEFGPHMIHPDLFMLNPADATYPEWEGFVRAGDDGLIPPSTSPGG